MSVSMGDLIRVTSSVIGLEEVNSVNARDIHNYVESKQDFSDWAKKRITQLNAVENEDYIVFHKKMENLKGGRPVTEYIVTLDIAKHLAMMERNAKGKDVRDYFIACEKSLHVKREREVLKPVLDYEGGKVAHILHGFKHDINPTAFLNVALISKFERMFGAKKVAEFYAELIGVKVEEVKRFKDPVATFAFDCVEEDDESFTRMDTLYTHYVFWANYNHLDQILGREAFLRTFSRIGKGRAKQKRFGEERHRGYNVRLLDLKGVHNGILE